jgi:hypothetical protein
MAEFAAVVQFVADCLTIATACVALYLFLFKRGQISAAVRMLVRHSLQVTLGELFLKLERLNDLNSTDPAQARPVIVALSEILGQLQGNRHLRRQCADVIDKIQKRTSNTRWLTNPDSCEATKRALVSELRERLRSVDTIDLKEVMETPQ